MVRGSCDDWGAINIDDVTVTRASVDRFLGDVAGVYICLDVLVVMGADVCA